MRFAVSIDAAAARLDGVELLPAVRLDDADTVQLTVAAPARGRRRLPLLIMLDSAGMLGSAIEMSRLMAQTRELRECIVVGMDCAADPAATAVRIRELVRWCGARYRVAAQGSAVFGAGYAGAHALCALQAGIAGVSAAIVSTGAPEPRLMLHTADGQTTSLPSHAEPGWPVPDLVRGLRALWGTGIQGGKGYEVLGKPWLLPLLQGASVPLRALSRLRGAVPTAEGPHLVQSRVMDRAFELFVALPRSYPTETARTYPVLLVLDANLEFSTAAEAAQAMAAAGVCGEALVVGIGVPRAEGMKAFAFRRFEEFSPPADGYDHDDGMGRIMRGLFALRGQDARERLGQAPLLYRFLCAEVLPLLRRHHRIDPQRLALLGHSAGGAFTCYSLLQQDSPFSGYAAISPGIGMSGFWLRRQLEAGVRPAPGARRVVLSIGAEEDEGGTQGSGIDQALGFAEQLRENGGVAVSYHCYDGESHASTYPRAVAQALRELLTP